MSVLTDTVAERIRSVLDAIDRMLPARTTGDPDEVSAYDLSPDEIYEALDARTRLYLSMSADEFLKRMSDNDLPDRPAVDHLKMLASAIDT